MVIGDMFCSTEYQTEPNKERGGESRTVARFKEGICG